MKLIQPGILQVLNNNLHHSLASPVKNNAGWGLWKGSNTSGGDQVGQVLPRTNDTGYLTTVSFTAFLLPLTPCHPIPVPYNVSLGLAFVKEIDFGVSKQRAVFQRKWLA